MPGRNCRLESNINRKLSGLGKDLDLFGFFYCHIKVSENLGLYIGLLPVRSDDGGVSLPFGE
jgi:hypothetical protein